jgi:hypothetical protein
MEKKSRIHFFEKENEDMRKKLSLPNVKEKSLPKCP